MALEQSINADSKSKGGVVGITDNQSALQRWFVTAHERASVATALKEMYAIRGSDRMGFSSNLMTNPFECDADNQLQENNGKKLGIIDQPRFHPDMQSTL